MYRAKFIRKTFPKDKIYDMWLTRLKKIEQSTISTHTSEIKDSLDISYYLLPLVDAISYNLFGKNGRFYLKKLGYSDAEADMAQVIFRNGQIHSGHNYHLVYDDGEVTWAMFSSGGSGGFRPYDPGYSSEEFPQDNQPAEKAIDYIDVGNGVYEAWLQLDRLAAHIQHDLLKRKEQDPRAKIYLIVGQRVAGKRRSPTRSLEDRK